VVDDVLGGQLRAGFGADITKPTEGKVRVNDGIFFGYSVSLK